MPRINADQRRTEIVKAALEVISAEGIANVSMRRIARQAGCTTGRLTHFFPNKEAILEAATRHAFTRLQERTTANVDCTGPPREVLRALLHEQLPLDAERRSEAIVIATFEAEACLPGKDRKWFAQIYDEWRSSLDEMAVQAQLSVTAAEVSVFVEGLVNRGLLQPERYPPRRLTEMLDSFLDR